MNQEIEMDHTAQERLLLLGPGSQDWTSVATFPPDLHEEEGRPQQDQDLRGGV